MNKNFVIISAVLMFAISTYFSYEFFSNNPGLIGGGKQEDFTTQQVNPAEVDKEGNFTGPKTEECPLNGKMLTKNHHVNWAKRRPMGIMIENHTEARPQSGLTSADVVYEFVAEGGITRFLAVFYCEDARFVGPVRSARVYFIDMIQGYGSYPLYVHVGGANTDGPADALGEISELGWANYNDMNQFSIPFPTFYRDYSRLPDVATEHTMYSSTDKLWKFAAEKRKLTNVDEEGAAWDEAFEPWTFADEKPGAGTTTTISYDFWEGYKTHSVTWTYDKATNSYVRSHQKGGKLQDLNTKSPISAKNVAVMLVKESKANDGYPGGHMLYGTVGRGTAFVFQNGDAIKATWRKPTKEDQVRFYDTAGEEIPMVRGQVWISGIPIGNEVEY
jgi:hypothetical protein